MDEEFEKEENTFLMIGRIFNNNNYANNKKFDTAIKVFNKLDTYKNFKLDIIGSVKHIDFYNHLSNLIKDKNRIKIHTDISDGEKNNLLKKSKYYIQLTGMGDKYKCNEEHFGISLIESLNYGCIPICFNGGYTRFLLDNQYLINNEEELFNRLNELIDGKEMNKPIINLNRYKYTNFFEEMKNFI